MFKPLSRFIWVTLWFIIFRFLLFILVVCAGLWTSHLFITGQTHSHSHSHQWVISSNQLTRDSLTCCQRWRKAVVPGEHENTTHRTTKSKSGIIAVQQLKGMERKKNTGIHPVMRDYSTIPSDKHVKASASRALYFKHASVLSSSVHTPPCRRMCSNTRPPWQEEECNSFKCTSCLITTVYYYHWLVPCAEWHMTTR